MKLTLKTGLLFVSLSIALLLPRSGQCFYNTSEGRWLTRDPIGESGGRNLYGFVSGNALSRFDANGQIGNDESMLLKGCFCRCKSVDVTYEPGGSTLQLGGYRQYFTDYIGSKVHVFWHVEGNRAGCTYFQDEGGTLAYLDGALAKEGVDGNRVRSAYTDYMGANWDLSGNLLPPPTTHTFGILWSVTFRCESDPHSCGGTVTRHDWAWRETTVTIPTR
jgi:hypothetical protein